MRAIKHWRMPVTLVSVVGFGGLVAIAVGLVLFLGLNAATQNTSQLLKIRSQGLVDTIEGRLDATLKPVVEQSRWVAQHLTSGAVDLADSEMLDTFMAGALAATPQVAGIGLITPDALIRRWGRTGDPMVMENWSTRPEIIEWLRAARARKAPAWNPPIWTHTIGRTVLVHDVPLHRDGKYLGILAQIVPIAQISQMLATMQRETLMVPFVLHDRSRVLAHPLLAHEAVTQSRQTAPLPRPQDLGDDILLFLDQPQSVPYLLRGITGLTASGAMVDGHYHVFLHRDVVRYGQRPWTIGVHFDSEVVAGDEPRRLISAIEVGLILLICAIAIAVFVGRRLSRPVQLLARAAEAVRAGHLENVPTLPASRVREFDTAFESFRQMVDGLRERQLIRDMLGRFVPESVARTMLARGGTLSAEEVEATLLFCDLEGFTRLTERVGPGGIMDLLNEYFEAMVTILERHGGIVTQFQGDAILATFNTPVADAEHASKALLAALEMQEVVRTTRFAGEELACRIGINTGPVVTGAVGAKGRQSYTVHGDAVNLAARLEALNKEYGTRILISGATASQVEGFPLRAVGEVTVRGQSTPAALYELEPPQTKLAAHSH